MTVSFFERTMRRVMSIALVLFVLSLTIFILARVVPGDPARMALGPSASAEQVAELQREMGLDQNLLNQYMRYLGGALQGDLGQSLVTNRAVAKDVAEFLPATLELVVVTVIIILVIALPLGVVTARYRNTWIDNAGRFFSLFGVTVPSFLFAVGLQLFASSFMPDWPILGRINYQTEALPGGTGFLLVDSLAAGRIDVFLNALQHLLFPALALAMSGIGQITRITRSAMIENLRKDHAQTLRSFGVPDRVVVFKYLFKLSSVAPLTIMGLEFASLIGNAFVVEMVFGWGGFASYGLTAILQKDLNALMAVVLVSGLFFIFANLAIDLAISVIDPRHRLRETTS